MDLLLHLRKPINIHRSLIVNFPWFFSCTDNVSHISNSGRVPSFSTLAPVIVLSVAGFYALAHYLFSQVLYFRCIDILSSDYNAHYSSVGYRFFSQRA